AGRAWDATPPAHAAHAGLRRGRSQHPRLAAPSAHVTPAAHTPDGAPGAGTVSNGSQARQGPRRALTATPTVYRSASAIPATTSRTAPGGSSDSPAARTRRLPTITPSAPASAAWEACSGVAIPKPSATGTSVCAFARPTTAANVSDSVSRSPVVPVTDTV